MRSIVVLCVFMVLMLSFIVPVSDDKKVKLGRYLFFDKNLSLNGTKACASCHDPKFAFTDGYRKSTGLYADEVKRNTPSLINSIKYLSLNWANPDITTFEKQVRRPLFGTKPPEMGNNINDTLVLLRFKNSSLYQSMFYDVYGSNDAYTWWNIMEALAAFERSLVSINSKYDQFQSKKTKLNQDESKGLKLFNSKKYKCNTCHTGNYFTDQKFHDAPFVSADLGVYHESYRNDDKNKFRTPSLRNSTFTAPYMHDGSIPTLKEATLICAKNQKISNIKDDEIMLITTFLHTLADSTILTNKAFSDPFTN
jgi:cytochrome c peroxidase